MKIKVKKLSEYVIEAMGDYAKAITNAYKETIVAKVEAKGDTFFVIKEEEVCQKPSKRG